MIGIVGVEAPSRLKLLAEAGATAILRKPIQAATVYSALFLGVNNHRRLKSAEARLAIVDRKRRGRRFLIKAVVALVQARGLSDDDAYAELRRESMRRRLDLEEFCESLFQPDSNFPAAWPTGLALSSSHDRGGSAHAQDADVGRRDGGDDDDIQAAQAAEPIKLGVLEDQSGDFALATIGKVHGIQLATDEINKAGGIAGRQIELVIYDTQSDNTRFQEFMRRVLQKDKVDVVFAGFSSASREAYRPIVDQLNGFAFYNNQYEGGVCDAHMIVTGAVPEQQFSTLIPWMMEKFGKKVYTIAADYNFGQISAEWVRNIVKQNGGEMVGEEFIPLGVSQFASTIQNIQKAKPDILITLLVGTAQSSYYEQAACGESAHSDGEFRQRRAGLRAQALQAAEPRQHVCDDQLDRGGRRSEEQGLRRQMAQDVPERALHQPGGRELVSRRLSLQGDGGARERIDEA